MRTHNADRTITGYTFAVSEDVLKRSAVALMERAGGTALLADTADAATAAMEIMEARPERASAAERAWARLRLAELTRRVAPQDAMELLDGVDHADADRVRCHALLDLLRFDQARTVAARIAWTDQARDAIVRARLEYLTSRDAALARLDHVIEAHDTAAEERAEALELRARWRAETGDLHGGACDFETLERMAGEHRAIATVGLARLHRDLYRAMATTSAAPQDAPSLVEAVKQGLARDIDCNPEKLGPVPAHVHALLVRLDGAAGRPTVFLVAVCQLAGLMETAAMIEDAYATLLYSGKLARRMFGADVTASIASRLELLLERVGAEHARALRDREERRAAAFLAEVRPATASPG
jgi:hypothetical protein